MNKAIENSSAQIASEELDKISGGYPTIGMPFLENSSLGSPIVRKEEKDDENKGGGSTGSW